MHLPFVLHSPVAAKLGYHVYAGAAEVQSSSARQVSARPVPTALVQGMLAALEGDTASVESGLLLPQEWQERPPAPASTLHSTAACATRTLHVLSASGRLLTDHQQQPCLRSTGPASPIRLIHQAEFCGLIPDAAAR